MTLRSLEEASRTVEDGFDLMFYPSVDNGRTNDDGVEEDSAMTRVTMATLQTRLESMAYDEVCSDVGIMPDIPPPTSHLTSNDAGLYISPKQLESHESSVKLETEGNPGLASPTGTATNINIHQPHVNFQQPLPYGQSLHPR